MPGAGPRPRPYWTRTTSTSQAGREDLTALYGQPYDPSEVRDHFAGNHAELRAFYARAADDGHAVVKWLLV